MARHDLAPAKDFYALLLTATESYPGPIVRIGPDELHIKDSDFYRQFYTSPQTHAAAQWWEDLGPTRDSLSNSIDGKLHHRRRTAMMPGFSMSSIFAVEPMVSSKVDRLCARMGEWCNSKKIMDLDVALTATLSDIMCQFCLNSSMDLLNMQDLGMNWRDRFLKAIEFMPLGRLIPTGTRIMETLYQRSPYLIPSSFAQTLHLGAWIEEKLRQYVCSSPTPGSGLADEKESVESILEKLMASKLPPEDKSLRRLRDETWFLLTAGTWTSNQAASRILYQLGHRRETLAKLREEIDRVYSSQKCRPSYVDLQKLPYLVRCLVHWMSVKTDHV